MENVGLMTRDAIDRAYKLRSTELRARALIDSAVAHSMRNRGEPEDARDFCEYAHDIALNAAALLIRHIYEDDAEIAAIRAERDHYKKLAEQSLMAFPPRLFISDLIAPPSFNAPPPPER